MIVKLKGDTITGDRRLDRIQQFDERSRAYGVSALALPTTLRGVAWRCTPRLDQGREGACVSFAWSHELAAVPVDVAGIDNAFAFAHYPLMQRVDEWPGEEPDYSGTSVLAGAKVMQGARHISGYHWAFSIDEVLQAISRAGPVVFGVPWKDSMYEPRPDGLLDCSGKVIGGHAILGRGLRLRARLEGVSEPVVRLRNSWSASWGIKGDAFLRVSDLEKLLAEGGECCLPLGRKTLNPLTAIRQRICT
jgi:hypothetical protein